MAIALVQGSQTQAPQTPPVLANRLYELRGAHIEGGNTRFCVHAPNARSVTLALTAYGNEQHQLPMKQAIDGSWTVLTDLAKKGRTYRYLVQDCKGTMLYRTDPFSFSTIETNGVIESRVSPVDQYVWNDEKWMLKRAASNPLQSPLAIYELYAQCWKKREGKPLNFRQLAPELIKYCKKMHFTHAELYAILDNVGGWGYQVLNFFAPNHAMGTAEDFQFLVDELHQNDIGVILDWIPAHYKHFPLEASLHDFDGDNPFSAGGSDWGTMLFDFSKEETIRLLTSNLHYWLREMHVDMVRIDAVSHIARREGQDYQPGIQFLKSLNRSVKEEFPGVVMIAEDPTNFPGLTESVEKGGLGFDLKWDIHAGAQMRNFLKTPPRERPSHHHEKFMDHLKWVKHREKALFTHSHDEQANRDHKHDYPVEKDQTLFRIDALKTTSDKFSDLRNFFAWQILAPSRGFLIHMGDEFGQKRSWDTAVWKPEGAIHWDLLDPRKEKDSNYHGGLQSWVSDLNQLYCTTPSFWKSGEQGFRLCCDHPDNNVVAYERSTPQEEGVFVVHNFSSGGWAKYHISLGKASQTLFPGDRLEEILNSNSARYGGSSESNPSALSVTRTKTGNELLVTVALPPLSTLILKRKLTS